MLLCAIPDGFTVFQFPHNLRGRFPGFYVITNLQRWLRPVVKQGDCFKFDDRRDFPTDLDQAQVEVDIVGQMAA